MGDSFTKLFSSIIHSTVWREPNHIRLVWITMLAMADERGHVDASIPGLADVARVSIPECEEALECFLSPDPYSRSKDHEGRRVEEEPGGWRLLNHKVYRDLRAAEKRKEQNREASRNYRAKKKAADQQASASVSKRQQKSARSAQAEAEEEAEAERASAPAGSVDGWARVLAMWETLAGLPGGTVDAQSNRRASEKILAHARGDLQVVEALLSAWLADPWVQKEAPKLSHLAENLQKYSGRRRPVEDDRARVARLRRDLEEATVELDMLESGWRGEPDEAKLAKARERKARLEAQLGGAA